MVSNKFLGALAVKLGLHVHLQHFSNPLMIQNNKYAEEIQLAESEGNGEVDYWLSTSDSPKVSSLFDMDTIHMLTNYSVFPTCLRLIWVLYLLILASTSQLLKPSSTCISYHFSTTCLFTTHLQTDIQR